jgi:alpha-1,3-mannosyltransferase
MYKWTVNWRMLPEELFLSRGFATVLLSAHVLLLLAFFHRKWTARAGGMVTAFTSCLSGKSGRAVLTHQQTLMAVFTANFVGIVCARSLHYQFYSWYFHSIPFLLWQTKLPVVVRVALFVVIEIAWNVFPSTVASSSMLLGAHLVLLSALWRAS